VQAYEASHGEQGNTLLDTRLPVIIVTSLGRSTGKVRKTPLMRVEHEGQYALVASYGGRPQHPAWYHHLKANPDGVTIQDGSTPFPADVRELDGDERAGWWARCVAAFSAYAEYEAKAGRIIPVFLASRRSSSLK